MAHWKVVLNIITCNLASLYVMPHVKTTIFPFSQDESVRGALKARREQHCFRKMSIIRVLLKACRAANSAHRRCSLGLVMKYLFCTAPFRFTRHLFSSI